MAQLKSGTTINSNIALHEGHFAATGDILYADASVNVAALTISATTGDILAVSASGIPEWVTPPSGTTNLAIDNRTATTLDITSSTGTDATIPAVTTTLSGLMTGTDKTNGRRYWAIKQGQNFKVSWRTV